MKDLLARYTYMYYVKNLKLYMYSLSSAIQLIGPM